MNIPRRTFLNAGVRHCPKNKANGMRFSLPLGVLPGVVVNPHDTTPRRWREMPHVSKLA